MPIPVIFQLSSEIGPGGFASLESAINMTMRLAKTVIAAVEELDKFSEMYQRVEIDMSSATSAAKGLIGSLEMMASANKLTLAGVKPTGEQFAAIAKGAVEMSHALGISSSEAMDKLTDSIVRGSARGLRPLGIELKSTGDLTDKQTEALEKLIEKFRGVNVEVDTLSDSFESLINNTKTYAGLLWTQGDATGYFAEEMSGLNEFMEELTANLQRQTDGVQTWGDTWTNELLNMTRGLGNIFLPGGVADRFDSWITDILVKSRQAAAALKGVVPELEAEQEPGMGRYRGASYATGEPLAPPAISKMPYTTIEGAKKGRTGGRAVTGAAGPTTADLLAESVDERIAAEEALAASSRQAAEEQLDQEQQYLEMQLRLMELKDADVEAMQAQQEQIDNVKIARMELQEVDARQIDLSQRIMEAERQRHDQEMSYVEQSRKQWNASLENKLQMSSFFFNRMSLMQNTQTKAGFAIGKTAAVASTTIDMISGSIAAYKALAGIPYVGPALGVFAAAAVTAAGMAAIRQIMSTSMGSTSSSTVSAGGGTSISTSSPGYSSVQPLNASPGQAVNVTVYLGEDNVYNAVEREDDRRSQRGARSFRA